MNNPVFPYLLRSFEIILANPKILIVYVVVGFLYFGDYINFEEGKTILFSISVVAFLFIWPAIYGRYIEIINGVKHESYWELFKRHWLDYYIVSIAISFPAIVFMIVKNVLDLPNVPIVNDFIDILINVLAIYVIPLVFLTQKRLHSIRLGLKCLIGNFNFSWLLVILIVISYILNDLFQEYGMTLFNSNLFITAMIGSIFSFILIVVDFAVFISASLILKEKIY
jgi:hypothetical protein